jgi:translation initiation factor IF-2
MTVSSKVRIYDLAKELKLDTKRLIEEVRREGVDVSVPSNSVSKELAEKIRNKYFPKKETTVKRAVKVVKRAVVPAADAPVVEAAAEPEVHEPEPEAPHAPIAAEPVEAPATTPAPAPVKPPMRLVKKMAPAVQAEAPAPVEEVHPPPPVAEATIPEAVEPPVIVEPAITASEVVAPTNGAEVKVTPAARAPVPPPSRQVRV